MSTFQVSEQALGLSLPALAAERRGDVQAGDGSDSYLVGSTPAGAGLEVRGNVTRLAPREGW